MTCAACSARIEKVVGRIEGVISVNVNLTTERMSVQFDSDKINIEEIKNTVDRIGYEAGTIVQKQKAVDEDQIRKEK